MQAASDPSPKRGFRVQGLGVEALGYDDFIAYMVPEKFSWFERGCFGCECKDVYEPS